jgi:hypothetical protein
MFKKKIRIAAHCGIAMAFISIAAIPSAKGDTYGYWWGAREAEQGDYANASGLGFASVNYSGANWRNFLGPMYHSNTAHGSLDVYAVANSPGGLDPGSTPPVETSGPRYSSAAAGCYHEVSVNGYYSNLTNPSIPPPNGTPMPATIAILNQFWFASASAAASYKFTSVNGQFSRFLYALGNAYAQTTTGTPLPSDTANGFGASLLATSPTPQTYGLAPMYYDILPLGDNPSGQEVQLRGRDGFEIIQDGTLVYGFQDDFVVGTITTTYTYSVGYYDGAASGYNGGIGSHQSFDTQVNSFNGSTASGWGWSSISAVGVG